MAVVAGLYRWGGSALARLLVYPIVGYFFLTDRAGRQASADYLRRVHAVDDSVFRKTPNLLHAFRHFLEFGITILDRVGFWLDRGDDFELKVVGGEHLSWVIDQGRGAVVLGSHLGSFDAMRLVAILQSPIGLKVLMYTEHAERINEVFRRAGEASGSDVTVGIIQATPGSLTHVFEVKQAIADGQVVAVLADRFHPNERGPAVEVEFLGERAHLPGGPFLLAATLGCPVVLMAGVRRGNRRYEIHVERFGDPVRIPRANRAETLAEVAQSYADWLQKLCLVAPFQWFNFFDFWQTAPMQPGKEE